MWMPTIAALPPVRGNRMRVETDGGGARREDSADRGPVMPAAPARDPRSGTGGAPGQSLEELRRALADGRRVPLDLSL